MNPLIALIAPLVAALRHFYLRLRYVSEDAFELPIQQPPAIEVPPIDPIHIVRIPSPAAIQYIRFQDEDYFLRPVYSRFWPPLSDHQKRTMVHYTSNLDWTWVPSTWDEANQAGKCRRRECGMVV